MMYSNETEQVFKKIQESIKANGITVASSHNWDDRTKPHSILFKTGNFEFGITEQHSQGKKTKTGFARHHNGDKFFKSEKGEIPYSELFEPIYKLALKETGLMKDMMKDAAANKVSELTGIKSGQKSGVVRADELAMMKILQNAKQNQ